MSKQNNFLELSICLKFFQAFLFFFFKQRLPKIGFSVCCEFFKSFLELFVILIFISKPNCFCLDYMYC